MTPTEDRLRELLKAATPGPWTFSFREGWAYPNTVVGEDRPDVNLDDPTRSFCREIIRPKGTDPGSVFCTRGKVEYEMANAECIAALRNSAESLLDELARLRADRERLRDATKELRTRVRHSQFFPSRGNADDEPQAIIEAEAVVQWIDELLREALSEPTPGGST